MNAADHYTLLHAGTLLNPFVFHAWRELQHSGLDIGMARIMWG
jgi:hypothetical protein